jgi:hypothetical protein
MQAHHPHPEDSQMNPRQRLFARAYALHHNASQAAREAGYSAGCASVTGTRLLANARVADAVEALEAAAADALGVTRQSVLDALVEAFDLARLNADPASMIAASRELARVCGFYPANRVKLDVAVTADVDVNRMNRLSDAELAAIIEAGEGAEA